MSTDGRKGPVLAVPATALLLLLLVAVSPAAAQGGGDPNECDAPGDEPDVIVGDLYEHDRHGTVGGITAFSLGTISCNVGTCWLAWYGSGSNEHPVIGQNMFRLKDGRFEQLGQSWLKHGFLALDQDFCSPDCVDAPGHHLGVNCSDPYSAFLNGDQDRLGPKFEVNASTGGHPHPVTDQDETGDAIFKRLQVRNEDLDPLLNAGALYFVEGQYVTEDDAAAGNKNNNASYRKVTVSGSSGSYDIAFDGPTQQELAAIRAWPVYDAGVTLVDVEVPDDGLFILGSKVTDLGNGTWHYEYAIHNLNSHRSGGSFTVPVPRDAIVTNVGFHDVDYHSGEPYDGTDWTVVLDNDEVRWSTQPIGLNENANALRWGTLYNFRFDADVEPALHDVTLGLFRPGTPPHVTVETWTPRLCNTNGACDPGETCGRCAEECANGICDGAEDSCSCPDDCGPPAPEGVCTDEVDNDCDQLYDCGDPDCCGDEACAPDDDSDTYVGCLDCDDANGDVWATPGEALGLILSKLGTTGARLDWTAPVDPGGTEVSYEVLRSPAPNDFVEAAVCLTGLDPLLPTLNDPEAPAAGGLYAYLPRATNDCPKGYGSLGFASDGRARRGAICP